MAQEMTGPQRRETILQMIRTAGKPLSGAALGKATGVTRQVVVQDIALLRSSGHPVVATARGYVLEKASRCTRLFKVCHTEEQAEEELNMIVDHGGSVDDVIVNHRAYGKVCASISIKSRRDVQNFKNQLLTGKSTLLMNITSGYHFHHVSAESEEILDEIEQQLKQMGFLAQRMPYEQEDM